MMTAFLRQVSDGVPAGRRLPQLHADHRAGDAAAAQQGRHLRLRVLLQRPDHAGVLRLLDHQLALAAGPGGRGRRARRSAYHIVSWY